MCERTWLDHARHRRNRTGFWGSNRGVAYPPGNGYVEGSLHTFLERVVDIPGKGWIRECGSALSERINLPEEKIWLSPPRGLPYPRSGLSSTFGYSGFRPRESPANSQAR